MHQRRCCFLTSNALQGLVTDDELARPPLEARGWRLDIVAWDDPAAQWSSYDLVVVRSTWDYHQRHTEFRCALDTIAGESRRLENPIELMRWNLDKRYLRDLEAQGVPVAPTAWRSRVSPEELPALFNDFRCEELVIKPVVGASASHTIRLRRDDGEILRKHWPPREAAAIDEWLVQPLVRSVIDEGEFSVNLFRGVPSHVVLKSPKSGDFRVQEEHGGCLRRVEATENLLKAADRVMAAVGRLFPGTANEAPLYARVDLVRTPSGDGFWLMELELLEPSLYLRLDDGAAERLAAMIDRTVASHDTARRSCGMDREAPKTAGA